MSTVLLEPEPSSGTVLRRKRGGDPALIFSGVLVVSFVLIALVGPYFVTDPARQSLAEAYLPPFLSLDHLLGTDQLGRDVLSRSVHGLRTSVLTGGLAIAIGAIVGTFIGLISGYFGGWLNEIVMRIVDVQLAIPGIILLMLMVTILQPSFLTVVIVLALLSWVVYVRVSRAEVVALKQQDMVTGLEAMGASPVRVMARHILPNIAGPLIVVSTIGFAEVIIAGAALSYLGLGVPPPEPTLGGMISDGQGALTAGLWWPVVMPGLLLTILILSISGLGEGLRIHLDPRSRATTAANNFKKPISVSRSRKGQ